MDSRLLAVSSFLLLGFFAAVSNAGGTPKGEAVLRRNPMQRRYKGEMMTPAEHAFLELKRSEMRKRTGEMPAPYDKRRQSAAYRQGFEEVEDVVIVPETQAQVTSPFGAQLPPLDFGSFGFEGSGDKFDEGFEFSGDFEEVSEGSGDSDELFEGSGEVEEMFEGSGDEDEEQKVGETLAEKLEALVGNKDFGSGAAKEVSEGSGGEGLGSGEAEEEKEEAPANKKNPTAAAEFGVLMGKNEALRDFVVELKKIAEDFEAKKEAIEEDMKVLTMILNGQKAVNNLWTKKIDGLKAEIEELDIELEDCDSKLDDLEARKRK